MKRDPPMWIAADSECKNVPMQTVDSVNEMFLGKKPIAKCYTILKNPDFDILNLEKDGYNKFFGENCLEWFINEMLEVKKHMKNYFKSYIEVNPDTIPESYDAATASHADPTVDAGSAIVGSATRIKFRFGQIDYKTTKRCSKCDETGDPH